MPAAHALDFATQFEIAADLQVVENAETIDDRKRPAHALEHLVRIEVQVRLVPDCQDDRIGAFHGRPHVLFEAQVFQRFLPMEEA